MQGFDWGQFIASTLTIVLLLLGALWWVKRNRMIGGTQGYKDLLTNVRNLIQSNE